MDRVDDMTNGDSTVGVGRDRLIVDVLVPGLRGAAAAVGVGPAVVGQLDGPAAGGGQQAGVGRLPPHVTVRTFETGHVVQGHVEVLKVALGGGEVVHGVVGGGGQRFEDGLGAAVVAQGHGGQEGGRGVGGVGGGHGAGIIRLDPVQRLVSDDGHGVVESEKASGGLALRFGIGVHGCCQLVLLC